MWAWALAAVFAAAIAYDLLRMPIQVYDSLGELLDAQASPNVWRSFVDATTTEGYFRPLRIAQIKMLFDVADGNYWPVYRGWHAVLLCAAFAFFIRCLRVGSRLELGATAFALVVFMGTHTFPGTVREAFPINHFLEIVIACLVALNLSKSRGGLWIDVLAVVVFVAATLTLESGVLVWVVVAAAWMVGLRGVSWRGLAAMTALLGVYLVLRFTVLDVGAPGLSERSSGFGLRIMDPPEIEARFAAAPYWFYAYNVSVSALSVFLGEPQNGVFVGVRSWLDQQVPPRVLLSLAAAIPTTALIAWAGYRTWRDRGLSSLPGRLLLTSVVVILANAALSYAYTKDEIMTVAGVFYAIAAFSAVTIGLEHVRRAGALGRAVLAIVLLVAGTAWAVKSAGLHYLLNLQAARHRYDWAVLPVVSDPVAAERTDDRSLELVRRLRQSALEARVPGPRYHRQWTEDLWGD